MRPGFIITVKIENFQGNSNWLQFLKELGRPTDERILASFYDDFNTLSAYGARPNERSHFETRV
jgi:hypothetical protein